MGTKHVFLLIFLLVGCGKDVSISNAQLEKFSSITYPDSEKVKKEGVLVKGASDKMKFEGKEYSISKYSSHLALTFIQGLSDNTETPVIFKGEVRTTEIVVETMEKK